MSKTVDLSKPVPTTYDEIMEEALVVRNRLREIEDDRTHLQDLENRMETAALNLRLAELWVANQTAAKW